MRFHLTIMTFALCGVFMPVLAADPEYTSTCQAITQTITESVSTIANSGLVASPTSTAFNQSLSTLTSYSTLTAYVTVVEHSTQTSSVPATVPVSVSVSALSSSSVFYYVDHNGTTSWLDGSPATTYSSFLTETIEVTVYPVSDAETVTVFSTEVFTLPPATSTSVVSAARPSSAASQSEAPPTTLTITSHLTEQITTLGTLVVTTGLSEGGATFSGPGTLGWNVSSTIYIGTMVGPHMTSGFAGSVTQGRVATTDNVTLSPSVVTVTKSVKYAGSTTVRGFSMANSSSFGTNTSSGLSPPHLTSGVSSNVSAYQTFSASSLVAPVSQRSATASSSPVSSSTSVLGTGLQGSYLITTSAASSTSVSSALASSSTFTKVYTNTTSAAAATPSVCGEYGDFTVTWDDEPNFSPTVPITDPYDAAPVFSPYHHLTFSNGYVYVPESDEPFQPISPPHLVMFLTNDTGPTSSTDAGLERPGEIGTGVRSSVSAFWFNVYSAYLGCDNEGPSSCIMQISAYIWQASSESEILAYQQNVMLPSCPGFNDCKLEKVNFATSMTGLSGIRIQAFVGGQQKMWFMDNLAMGWYNNTCSAGLLRQSTR